MIQRKQTVYLLIAAALNILCLCMPIGSITEDGRLLSTVYNLFMSAVNGHGLGVSYMLIPLFVSLLLTTIICFVNIFLFHKRKLQMRICVLTNIIYVIYYVCAALNVSMFSTGKFTPSLALCFPLIAFIFVEMARRGVKHDERLVRAADRIR